MKEAISTTLSPLPAGLWSQGIAADTFVFVAGRVPMAPKTKRTPQGIENQTHQVVRDIEPIPGASGASLDDVPKATAHLPDLSGLAAFDRVYREYFDEPDPVPTTTGSQLLGS